MKKSTLVAIIVGAFAFLVLLVTVILVIVLAPKKEVVTRTTDTTQKTETKTQKDAPKPLPVRSEYAVDQFDTTIGLKDAKTTVFFYTDYQCPGCAVINKNMKSVVEQYKGSVLFVYRNFPLERIHPNARNGAYAVEAAQLQGKFLEMKNKLYDNRSDWIDVQDPAKIFENYARDLGLDVTKFDTDMRSDTVKTKVDSDLSVAQKLGLNTTPTVIINKTPLTTEELNNCLQGDMSALTSKLGS